jgi:hypothetical protein
MCDYSLMTFPNRLANEGEILVTHKFSTGSIGFVSREELDSHPPLAPCAPVGLWSRAKAWLLPQPTRSALPAVCIPPGARLKVQLIPRRMRERLNAEPEEEVIFTQITAAWNQFRDAFRTKSKQEILLQTVGEGLQIQVVSLSLADEAQPAREEYSYSMVPRS